MWYVYAMGNQTKTINNVELLHGEVKNAVNKGFLEAFVVCQGSDRLNLREQMSSQKLGLREDTKDNAHGSMAVKAVKRKGSIEVSPSLPKLYQSTIERNNHRKYR
jgi:hypothetical protein